MKYTIENRFSFETNLINAGYYEPDEEKPNVISRKDYKNISYRINNGTENHSIGYIIIDGEPFSILNLNYLINSRTKFKHEIIGGGLVMNNDNTTTKTCLLIYYYNEINIFDEYFVE
jgi:hypothetical protein